MLLSAFNHVAVLTGDTERFLEFYANVFGATHEVLEDGDGFRATLVWVTPTSELNVFELRGNPEQERQVPMFGRGRLDHLAFEAASLEAFDEIRDRLLARDATDGFVTDFGPRAQRVLPGSGLVRSGGVPAEPRCDARSVQPARDTVSAVPPGGNAAA
ncbi:MAG: VOC family protein [Acidimicrobiales bacterium]|nr:VOC family protein [Acidimicrobiales bacterium]